MTAVPSCLDRRSTWRFEGLGFRTKNTQQTPEPETIYKPEASSEIYTTCVKHLAGIGIKHSWAQPHNGIGTSNVYIPRKLAMGVESQPEESDKLLGAHGYRVWRCLRLSFMRKYVMGFCGWECIFLLSQHSYIVISSPTGSLIIRLGLRF